jgi:hypothetical protein
MSIAASGNGADHGCPKAYETPPRQTTACNGHEEHGVRGAGHQEAEERRIAGRARVRGTKFASGNQIARRVEIDPYRGSRSQPGRAAAASRTMATTNSAASSRASPAAMATRTGEERESTDWLALRRQSRVHTSVIVPVYNSASDLEDALAAIRAQSDAGVEIIVVDDASSDDSAAVAERHGALVLRPTANAGPAAARNLAARVARGAVLFFVDADVVLHPSALARARSALTDDPALSAVFGSYDAHPRHLVWFQYRTCPPLHASTGHADALPSRGVAPCAARLERLRDSTTAGFRARWKMWARLSDATRRLSRASRPRTKASISR